MLPFQTNNQLLIFEAETFDLMWSIDENHLVNNWNLIKISGALSD